MSKHFGFWLILIAVGCSCFVSAGAQDTPAAAPDAKQQSEAKPGEKSEKTEDEKKLEREEQSRRVLGVLPQFAVTNRQDAPPLAPHEKLHLFAKSAFDPVTIGLVAFQAGLSQEQNEFPAYGQGMQGYGKRFRASLADSVSSGFFSNFFYPTLLKEDPRYFRLGEGSFGHRFVYGIKQEFVCHTDRGGRAFNFSNVLGAFTSGALSNLYYPGKTLIRTTNTVPPMPVYENDRGVGLTMSRATIALGYGMGGGLLDEFWPDIQRKLSHKRANRDSVATVAPAP